MSVCPRKTARRRNNSFSGSLSRSWLHASAASMVRCRRGASRSALPSNPSPLPTRSAICSAVRTGTRAAASSRASGMPSSRRHSRATASTLAAVNSNPGHASCARSTNNCTDADFKALSTRSLCSVSSSGTDNGGTSHKASPSMPSASRPVARTRSSGHCASRVETRLEQVSMTCSQLSSTSSIRDERNRLTSASICGTSAVVGTSVAEQTVGTTSPGSSRGARSTQQASSAISGAQSRATRNASRVLPAPPIPVSVTSRWRPRRLRTSATDRLRPKNAVRGLGKENAIWGRND